MDNNLKRVLKYYNVKLKFVSEGNFMGQYQHNIRTIIVLSEYKNDKELIPIIFHELGHKHCYDNNLFHAYHYDSDLRLVKLTALKAERFVDKWAAKTMIKWGFNDEYPMYYFSKSRTKAFKKILKNMPM